MKPKTKILLLSLAFMLPYMALVMYLASHLHQNRFPTWFLYFAPSYFFGSILVLAILGKRIQRNTPPQDMQKNKLSGARAARLLGYIFLISPASYVLSGQILRRPAWASVLVLSWACLLSWGSFYIAKKNEMESDQRLT
jgi:hypothetical protein